MLLRRARLKRDCELIARSGLFDRRWYFEQHPDAKQSAIDPIVHYLQRGMDIGCNPHPLFHSQWYLTQYPEVRTARINPLIHYLSHGAAEGKDPNPMFDTDWYVESNPDV